MARTIRRTADFARRHLLQQDAWSRQDASLGRTPPALGPRQTGWGFPAWELTTDNYGSDSAKPYKRDAIREHTSSVRRFVRDALAKGAEPVVCNERSRWYSGVGVVGTVVPVDADDTGALFGTPDTYDDEPVCPPNTMCGCGEALATVAIEFSSGDVRFYCYPCS